MPNQITFKFCENLSALKKLEVRHILFCFRSQKKMERTSHLKIPWIYFNSPKMQENSKKNVKSLQELVNTLQKLFMATKVRVNMVGTIHDDLLTQWRHIPMGQFRANISLIRTTSNYLWASEVSKNQGFEIQLFLFSHASNQCIIKLW